MLIPSRNEYRFSWVHPTPETKNEDGKPHDEAGPTGIAIPPGEWEGRIQDSKRWSEVFSIDSFSHLYQLFWGWEASNRQNKKYRTDWWGWIMATTQDFREYITQNQQAFYRLAYSYTEKQ